MWQIETMSVRFGSLCVLHWRDVALVVTFDTGDELAFIASVYIILRGVRWHFLGVRYGFLNYQAIKGRGRWTRGREKSFSKEFLRENMKMRALWSKLVFWEFSIFFLILNLLVWTVCTCPPMSFFGICKILLKLEIFTMTHFKQYSFFKLIWKILLVFQCG